MEKNEKINAYTHKYLLCIYVHTHYTQTQNSIYCDLRWRERTWVKQTYKLSAHSTNWKVPLVWYASVIQPLHSLLLAHKCSSDFMWIQKDDEGDRKKKTSIQFGQKVFHSIHCCAPLYRMATARFWLCLRASVVVMSLKKKLERTRTQNITQDFYLLCASSKLQTFITNRHAYLFLYNILGWHRCNVFPAKNPNKIVMQIGIFRLSLCKLFCDLIQVNEETTENLRTNRLISWLYMTIAALKLTVYNINHSPKMTWERVWNSLETNIKRKWNSRVHIFIFWAR